MILTIDALRNHRFPGHGELTFDWAGRLLHSQARGPFNFEMVRAGIRGLGNMSTALWPQDGGLVELVQWHDSMLMPQDAFDYYSHALTRFAAKGFVPMCTLVVAAPEVEARWLMLPRYEALWSRYQPVESFEALEPALARATALIDAYETRQASA